MDSGSPPPGTASAFSNTESALTKQVSLLRDQFVALAENLASTEERIAFSYEFSYEEAARRHPSKAGRYWQAAEDARVNAQRAREIARRFGDAPQ